MSGCSSVAEVWVPAPRRTIHRVSRQNQLCLGVSCLSSQVDALPITKSGKRDIQAIEHLGHGQKWARFAQCCLSSAFAVGYTECEFGVVPKAACGWLGQDREGAAFAISEGSSTCIVFIAYLYHEVIEYNSEEEQLVAAAFNEACWTTFLRVWDMWMSSWRRDVVPGSGATSGTRDALLGGAWDIVTHDDTMRRCVTSFLGPGWRPFLVRHEESFGPGHWHGVYRLASRFWGRWVFARIAKLLGISPVELFKYPTIASLAKFLESMKVWKRIEFLTLLRSEFMNCVFGQDTKPAKSAFVVSLPRMPQPSNGASSLFILLISFKVFILHALRVLAALEWRGFVQFWMYPCQAR